MRAQRGGKIDKCAAGGNFVVNQYQRLRLCQQLAVCGVLRQMQKLAGGVAVLLFKAAGFGTGNAPPAAVQLQRLRPRMLRERLLEYALRQRGGGFGHADKQHGAA